ncbi:MAG: hypothetical protein K0B87_04225 [Candidatus Syntrophosphaera sp.]|nr:hypothetical protein [Candidatus Syntrophosphaera sp.]
MLRAILILAGLSLLAMLAGADIDRVEYYFDADPGFGSGSALALTPGEDILIDALIDLPALSSGMHRLYLRARDTDGVWSQNNSRLFFKVPQSLLPISRLEYWFDTDPGYGSATPLAYTGSTVIYCEDVIPTTGLDNGLHTLYIRVQSATGQWSRNYPRFVFKSPTLVPPLTAVRYYFDDEDDGVWSVPATPYLGDNTHTVLDFTIDCHAIGLAPGLHILHAYAENGSGYGSLHQVRFFYYVPNVASDISRICWRFSGGDANPDLEYYLPINPPLADVTQSLAASAVHLTQDIQYRLHVYVRDQQGNISQHQVLPFPANFIPRNVTLNISGSLAILNWDQVQGATYYVVKFSEDPLAEGTPYTVTGTSYVTAATAAKKFLKVLAGEDWSN